MSYGLKGEVMPRLILVFNKQVIKEYSFMKGSMTVGRNDDNDIIVDNLAVSSYHAKLDKVGPDFIITDLQSTNGTFVNDKKTITHKLTHGDNIQIGKHVILFVATQKGKENEGEAEAGKSALEKTMMLDTVKQKDLLAKQNASAPAKVPQKVGVISFIDSSDANEIELTKKLTKIGKAATSEIKFTGMFMPATAATISRRPTGYTITFAGGMAKLKVNGEIIKDSIALKDFDTIELGSRKFQFYQKETDSS
jgi:pSer/pThr/pTyr-binding forkhead associated (FHA) protein